LLPQTDPPDASVIPKKDLLGVTVVLVTCSFKEQEFIRVGYYVSNELAEPLAEGEPVPDDIKPEAVLRNVLADKPRVTRFPIDWS